MIPGRVRQATALAFLAHGVFILTARYRLSYDAYNHMFFGDHYRLDWWNLWEPRWYTGFEVTSYPPLVHQLIGLFGRLIGVDAAFALLLWIVLMAYPLAIYAFSRVFTGKIVSGYAALAAAVLPSIYQASHTFGQLPTLTGALFALFGVSALNEYLRRGTRLSGALTVSLFTVIMASHHATLLFLPWIIAATLLHIIQTEKPGPHFVRILLTRLAWIGFLSAAAGVLVIWPFWAWGLGQSMQTPIDHPSRHNFLTDPFAPVAFFLPVYGPLIPILPFALCKGLRKNYFGLRLAFAILFVLGLGGTTPLPRWLFGPGWEWLTYDRFALWASLVFLPLFGIFVVLTRKKISKWTPSQALFRRLSSISPVRLRKWVFWGSFSALGLSSIISGLLPTLLPTQPAQIDMRPIVRFLAEGDHTHWRYVTFGLGDQLAYLSRLTDATTIDGSYHTARNLPELRSSGIGQIDTAYWLPDGFTRLDPILQKSGQRGVRWGFVNRRDYIPILQRNGWVYWSTFGNGVEVWENPQALLPPPVAIPAENALEQFSWGVFPLSALLLAGAFSVLRIFSRGERLLFGAHELLIGVLPVGLCFWYYRSLLVVNHPNVYFTYDNVLIFLSDALALGAFLCWAIAKSFGRGAAFQPAKRGAPITMQPAAWVFGLCLLASISSLWSKDWRTSLYISMHWWLVYGLILSLQDRPNAWRSFALGSFAALFLQIMLGFWQFGVQSTAFMKPFGLNWPGELLPTTNGASVVQLLNGERWLRVYGTLPHPNILGGLILLFLAGLTITFIKGHRRQVWTPLLFGIGVVLLVLTFSRSAWLGFAIFALALGPAFSFIPAIRKRLTILFLATVLGLAVSSMTLHELIFTRVSAVLINTETFSISARTYLAQQAIAFFRTQPLTGVGIGAFIIQLSNHTSYGYLVEPVHNVFLLAISELGISGVILLLGLAAVVLRHSIRVRQVESIVFSALMAGLFVISLFDHYLWTLAPGRLLFGLAFGLWAGQIKRESLPAHPSEPDHPYNQTSEVFETSDV